MEPEPKALDVRGVPRRARLDVRAPSLGEPPQVTERGGGQLGVVVAPDERRRGPAFGDRRSSAVTVWSASIRGRRPPDQRPSLAQMTTFLSLKARRSNSITPHTNLVRLPRPATGDPPTLDPQQRVPGSPSGSWRWVERCCPTCWHARRTQMPRRSRSHPDRLAPAPRARQFLRHLVSAARYSACDPPRSASTRVLQLELLQPLHIVGLHPAVLRPPPVIARLRHLNLLTSCSSMRSSNSRSAPRNLRTICSGV